MPVTSHIPIIPINDASSFLQSIIEYFENLSPALSYGITITKEPGHSVQTFSLLRHMMVTGPLELISEHDAYIISDLFPSFQALSVAIRTAQGRQLPEDYLGSVTARYLIDF